MFRARAYSEATGKLFKSGVLHVRLTLWRRVGFRCPCLRPQTPGKQQQTQARTLASTAQSGVIDRYCLGCHIDKAKNGGLRLGSYDLSRVGENAELWEKVVRKTRA